LDYLLAQISGPARHQIVKGMASKTLAIFIRSLIATDPYEGIRSDLGISGKILKRLAPLHGWSAGT